MSVSKQKFKSDRAADRALKRTSPHLVEQLDLFDTTLHLHAMDGLTLLETEKLGNFCETQLERKRYLVTTVIPSKGQYKGMKLLMRALRQTEQYEVLSLLEKTYDEEVNAIISKKPELKHKTGEGYPIQATASDCDDSMNSVLSDSSLVYKDGGGNVRRNRNITRSISTSSSSDEDNDEVISLDSPVVEQQPQTQSDHVISPPNPPVQQSPCYDVNIRLSNTATVTVTSSPHRPRSDHISCGTSPYKAKPTEQHVSITVNPAFDNFNNNNNAGANIQQSIDQLTCDSPIMKFVFVGDAGTGKTSLLERYINKKFSIAFKPTILVDFMSTELTCYNIKYKLHLWDTAGQERFKALTSAYYRDAVGGFVVYDVTQRISLDHCLQWKKDINDEINDIVQLSNGDPIPIILIANKIDCGQLDGEQFSKENGFAGYFETSAKKGDGIKEAIHFMVKKVHELSCADQESVVRTLSRSRAISIKLQSNKEDENNRKRCCWQQ